MSCSSTIQEHKVNVLAVVGDAFCKPMLAALDADPGTWDISSVIAIVSSGVMWSEETKQGLLKHHGGMLLSDNFSSSEALGMGASVSTAAGTSKTAKFKLGENARVITDDGRDVEPGSRRGRHRRREGAHAGRLLQGPGEVRGDVQASSTASATRFPATSPPSRPTAR